MNINGKIKNLLAATIISSTFIAAMPINAMACGRVCESAHHLERARCDNKGGEWDGSRCTFSSRSSSSSSMGNDIATGLLVLGGLAILSMMSNSQNEEKKEAK